MFDRMNDPIYRTLLHNYSLNDGLACECENLSDYKEASIVTLYFVYLRSIQYNFRTIS